MKLTKFLNEASFVFPLDFQNYLKFEGSRVYLYHIKTSLTAFSTQAFFIDLPDMISQMSNHIQEKLGVSPLEVTKEEDVISSILRMNCKLQMPPNFMKTLGETIFYIPEFNEVYLEFRNSRNSLTLDWQTFFEKLPQGVSRIRRYLHGNKV